VLHVTDSRPTAFCSSPIEIRPFFNVSHPDVFIHTYTVQCISQKNNSCIT